MAQNKFKNSMLSFENESTLKRGELLLEEKQLATGAINRRSIFMKKRKESTETESLQETYLDSDSACQELDNDSERRNIYINECMDKISAIINTIFELYEAYATLNKMKSHDVGATQKKLKASDLVEKLRKQKEILREISGQVKNFKSIPKLNDYLFEIQKLAKETCEFDLVFEATCARADYYMQCKEISKALKIFEALSRCCRKLDKQKQFIHCLFMIGICYRRQEKHKEACNIFKRILQKAWESYDQELELKVYENLSYEHYYLENIEKAKYYFMRYHRGWVETEDSTLRKQYIQIYMHKQHELQKNKRLNPDEVIQKEENIFLPSPSDSRSCFKYKDRNVSDMKLYNTVSMDKPDEFDASFSDLRGRPSTCSYSRGRRKPLACKIKLTELQMKDKISKWMRCHIRKPHKPRTFKEIVEFVIRKQG
ncbi:unnamed protein product [Moneuplotes crassus]|uniref:Uncharacterized protein n=1 Tax=Euplotes crassus TaxID=5936 RepID=A0AAD1XRE5_EUPCR|nr:unnamed protein product [Moneuplotes crassus]